MIESVLIVDDEGLIRKTLIKMIESNNTGWEIAGEASNGVEALQMIECVKPELVITDIRMPRMDGLRLTEELHVRGIDTKVIILTGYKDFAYAQAALKFGVVDFLLKPCPEEEVIKALNKVRQTIQQQKQRKQMELRLEEETSIRTHFNRMPVTSSIIQRVQHKYAQTDLFLVRVKSFFPPEKDYRKEELNLLQFAVNNIMTDLLDIHLENGTSILIQFDTYVVFLGKPRQEGEFVGEQQDRFIDRLIEMINKLLGLTIEAQYIGAVERLQELPDLYETMQHKQRSMRNDEAGGLFSFQEQTRYSAEIESMENEFMSYILIGNMKQLDERIRSLADCISATSLNQARMEALVLAVALDRIVRQHFSASSVRLDIGKEVAELHRFQQVDDISSWIQRWTSALIAEITHWSEANNQSIIQRAIRYIEQHYAERCGVQDVAAHVYLNHKYFGHLFKQECGESFINYLTRIRMEKASVLLSNTDLMVTQIAAAIGYDDPNYFTTVFRKKYNMTPNEYRKHCLTTDQEMRGE